MSLFRYAPTLGLIAFGALLVFAFEAIGELYMGEYLLDLGWIEIPSPKHLYFLAFSTFFGSLAAAVWLMAFLRLSGEGNWVARALERWRRIGAIGWVVAVSVIAFLLPFVIRAFVLEDNVLTDDETAYQFTAELIASGRLSVDSPPLKLFFDRAFMINDGQLYSMYFIGWPLLMTPGLWLGVPGFMNTIYFALTVPPLFAIARRLVGPSWAKLTTLLFVTSPILMLCAATQLSNTSVIFALVYALWFFMRSQDDDSPWWSHLGCALFFCLAFFIRPTTAIGIGGPIVALWAIRQLPRKRFKAAAVAAFVIPSLVCGSMFLFINKAQTGSYTTSAYSREHQYVRENGFRFTNWSKGASDRATVAHFRGDLDVKGLAAASGVAAFRLLFSALGIPIAFIFLFFARRRRWTALLWSMLICHFVVHCAANVPGLDIFGPHRYVAAAVPLILLIVLGARHTSQWLARNIEGPPSRALRLAPPVLLVLAMALSVRMYLPIRVGAMGRMTSSISYPFEEAAKRGIDNAVIFARRPFSPACNIAPTRHYVYWRPNNSPDLDNRILWVNHIDVESNRRLMKFFPNRTAWIHSWSDDCTLDFLPLDGLGPDDMVRERVGGTNIGLPPYPTPEERALEQQE